MRNFTLNLKSILVFCLFSSTTFLTNNLSAQCNGNVNDGGNISSSQTINSGQAASTLISMEDASGGVGTTIYQWMYTVTPGAFSSETWGAVPNSNSPTLDPGNLTQNTYYIRCARKEGCTTSQESNIISITVIAVLPVELTSFKGENINGSVVLNWSTASEINHSYFAIEHSVNGEDFEIIGEKEGNGVDSREVKNYSFADKGAVSGKNYYRLRQVDLDGKEDFSNVITVEMPVEADMAVSPNPATDFMKISLSELPEETTTLVIYHAQTGAVVKTQLLDSEQLNYSFSVEDLVSGLYLIQVQSENGMIISTSKVMKTSH